MIRPLFPALAFLTLILASCTQSVTPSIPTADVPAVSTTAGTVTLRLPAPTGLTAQYLNAAHTTRIDVQIDGGTQTSYVLGSAQAPCANGFCTIDLGVLRPASHTFSVGSYGLNPTTGQTVLISQGSVTQVLATGQHTDIALTLTPVNTTTTLVSAVKQYNRVTGSFGNYVSFAAVGGRSLPAYYDVQSTDSVGDPLPAVLCGDNASVAISDISDLVHPGRFRVEVQALGAHTLSVKAGSACTPGAPALASQAVSGVATRLRTISGGATHSLALLADGTLRAWGGNPYGQLGDGATKDRSTPVPVSGLTTAVSVAAGPNHSLALLSDGTVRAWGLNTFGVLGDGTTLGHPAPAPVSNLQDAVGITTGGSHNLALLADGSVRAWGNNQYGQLGDGTTTNRSLPVTVLGLSGVVSVTNRADHSLALLSDGTVRDWGYNSFGQLGDGTTTNRSTPVAVSGLTNVVSIGSGSYHNLAVLSDGTVRAWGYNGFGQLGDGTTTNRSTPMTVSVLSGVRSVLGGSYHSLALLDDGTVRAWGDNSSGQLGDGTTTRRTTPLTVPGLSGAVSISGGNVHSLAVLGDGTVRAWGYNNSGQLGDGTTTQRTTPVQVSALSTVAQPTP